VVGFEISLHAEGVMLAAEGVMGEFKEMDGISEMSGDV
jgi:hypothetical protein